MNQVDIKRQQTQWLVHIVGLIGMLILGGALGDLGLALTLSAFYVYGFVFIIFGGNAAGSSGRLIRIRIQRGQLRNVRRIRKVVLGLQLAAGIFAGILCIAGSGFLPERVFQLSLCTLPILLMAPAVLFRCVSEALNGVFIGEGNGLPVVVGSALRYVCLILFGLILVRFFGGYGEKVSALLGMEHYTAMYRSVGVSGALVLSEFLVLVFLGVSYRSQFGRKLRPEGGMQSMDRVPDVCRHLVIDQTGRVILGILMFLPLIMGFSLFRGRVEQEDLAAGRYAVYAGKYLVVCAICFCASAGCLIPTYLRASAAIRRDDYRVGRNHFQTGFHMCVLCGLFFSMFLTVMADPMARLLEKDSPELLSGMFRGGSFLILLALISYLGTSFLVGGGMRYQVLLCGMFFDVVFFLTVSMLMKRNASEHISFLVTGGILAMTLYCVLVVILSLFFLRGMLDWIRVAVIPVAVGGACGLVLLLFSKLFLRLLGGPVTLILALILMVVLYWGGLLFLRDIREQELRLLPFGDALGELGKSLHLF